MDSDGIYTGPERRRPGRPRLVPTEETGTVTVRLPAGLHDDACKLAHRYGMSLGAVLRIALERLIIVSAKSPS